MVLQEPLERHILKRKSHPLLPLGGTILIGILDRKKHIMFMLHRLRYVYYKTDFLYSILTADITERILFKPLMNPHTNFHCAEDKVSRHRYLTINNTDNCA
jgi:hypothetical protein